MTESTVVRTPRGHFRKLGDATVWISKFEIQTYIPEFPMILGF